MAPYATVAQFRSYLPNATQRGESDELIEAVLTRASAIIDTLVGGSFTPAGAASARTFYGDGTDYLALAPYVAGTLAGLTGPGGAIVSGYAEIDGLLVIADSTGRIPQRYPGGLLAGYGARWGGGWGAGTPYVATARWGYETVPGDIVECCLELAIRIWRGRDASFSTVIGVAGGGAVGYEKDLPPLMKTVLKAYRERYSLGVW